MSSESGAALGLMVWLIAASVRYRYAVVWLLAIACANYMNS